MVRASDPSRHRVFCMPQDGSLTCISPSLAQVLRLPRFAPFRPFCHPDRLTNRPSRAYRCEEDRTEPERGRRATNAGKTNAKKMGRKTGKIGNPQPADSAPKNRKTSGDVIVNRVKSGRSRLKLLHDPQRLPETGMVRGA